MLINDSKMFIKLEQNKKLWKMNQTRNDCNNSYDVSKIAYTKIILTLTVKLYHIYNY